MSISPNYDSSVKTLNTELAKIYDWLAVNKLSLNVSKTKFMIFHHPTKKIPNDIVLELNNTPIERVREFCFLGLHIHENLTWKTHIDKISSKISKYTGIINKLKRFLPKNILRTLYCSLIQSQLNYCILVWGFECNRIEKIQKKSIRMITCSRYNAHTEPLFRNLELLKVSDLFKLNILKFFYKLKNETLPVYFDSIVLNSQSEIHDHDTRFKKIIPSNNTRSQLAGKCVRHVLPSILNSTDDLITSKVYTHTYESFSKYIKQHIIKNYATQCLLRECYICNIPL